MDSLILSTAEEKIITEIGQIADILAIPTYVVGGFVRDKLLGRKTPDIDIVCIGDAVIIAEQYKICFAPKAIIAHFKNFGTVQIKEKHTVIELVSARKESYQHNSRNPQVLPGTFEEDQARRDFTINTLAFSINKATFGKLIDTFSGITDLENKIIKTPLDPHKTFSDDPLRMFRAIRFATQLDFSIHPNTLNAIKENKERIQILSKERITEELNKIIASPVPSKGLLLLDKVGLLNPILPELTRLKGIEYIDHKGHKDNFYHSLQVLDNIARETHNLYLRWTALLHDIGKTYTKKFSPESGWTFHMHEYVGMKMIDKICKRLKLPLGEKMNYIKQLILLHHRPISLTKENITDAAIRRLLFDAKEHLEDLLILCNADITSKNEAKVKHYKANFEAVKKRLQEVEEKDKIRNWQPPITGEIIMQTFKLPPSKIVGTIKDQIREAILEGTIENTYEAALAYMHQIAKTLL